MLLRLAVRLSNYPVFSILGILQIAMVLVMQLIFVASTEMGWGFMASVFRAVFLWSNTLWGLLAFIEFVHFKKELLDLKSKYRSGQSDEHTYRETNRTMARNYGVSVTYMVLYVLSLAFLVLNWEEFNI